jgi:hypothetical protein
MAVVYNGCHSNQSTVERDVEQYGGREVKKMAGARAWQQAQQTPRDVLVMPQQWTARHYINRAGAPVSQYLSISQFSLGEGAELPSRESTVKQQASLVSSRERVFRVQKSE